VIVSRDFNSLAPSEKAALIYTQAQNDVAARLWRAALGNGSDSDEIRSAGGVSGEPASGLDMLLSLVTQRGGSKIAAPQGSFQPIATVLDPSSPATSPQPSAPSVLSASTAFAPSSASSNDMTGLGPNQRFGQALAAAATRTNIPAAALAAIVDAEAAKSGDGSWKTASRNPRSSAAGLGQFLGGTWQSEAERAGTWLHETATSQGWLGGDGRVLPAARSALLALRYDATASINATADYALRSVTQLKQAGVTVGEDLTSFAQTAYLGHHLGTGDAVRFLTGGLTSERARRLLDAQVGSAAASQRIARSGDATTAHRTWLLDFVNRHITPTRFKV
jgi:hypothetical protein